MAKFFAIALLWLINVCKFKKKKGIDDTIGVLSFSVTYHKQNFPINMMDGCAFGSI